jgi:hypothetical protein
VLELAQQHRQCIEKLMTHAAGGVSPGNEEPQSQARCI